MSKKGNKFTVFGKEWTRTEAEWFIFKDLWVDIIGIRITPMLEGIILDGWKGVTQWSDTEIQDKLDDLDESIETIEIK